MKIATIVGARPQFIKAAVLSRLFKNDTRFQEIIIHTGQHYDQNMSDVFFSELQIPLPKYNLEVGSGLHGEQTGKMLQRLEEVFLKEKPDMVIVYGDTNSTIAGALAASKLHIPIAHVEAGLRSFNKKMPEEINRIATDHISDILFAPTQNAMNLLKTEGLANRSFFSGDVMYDSVLYYKGMAKLRFPNQEIEPFYLTTIHRQENTDDSKRLEEIFEILSLLDKKVILPLHPRTKKLIADFTISEKIKIIEPIGYLEMLHLIDNSDKVITDSGGLQKEAFFMDKCCITLRDETEWIETLEDGWNFLTGVNKEAILNACLNKNPGVKGDFFGDGKAGYKILETIIK